LWVGGGVPGLTAWSLIGVWLVSIVV
jgi:hypothetical protein